MSRDRPDRDQKTELRALCERYRVVRLALFGSALRDDFDSGQSDLDFCMEFAPMTPQEHAESYFGLLEDLKGFRAAGGPAGVGAVRTTYLRWSIEDEGVGV